MPHNCVQQCAMQPNWSNFASVANQVTTILVELPGGQPACDATPLPLSAQVRPEQALCEDNAVTSSRCARRHLMRFLELVARKTEMHEVMLTVQLQNADALRMYRNLGYEDHWDQPETPEGKESAPYVILTKKLPASAAQQQRALKPVTNSYQLENIIYG